MHEEKARTDVLFWCMNCSRTGRRTIQYITETLPLWPRAWNRVVNAKWNFDPECKVKFWMLKGSKSYCNVYCPIQTWMTFFCTCNHKCLVTLLTPCGSCSRCIMPCGDLTRQPYRRITFLYVMLIWFGFNILLAVVQTTSVLNALACLFCFHWD